MSREKISDSLTLLGIGDIHPGAGGQANELFEHSAELLRSGDITFGQLEVLFSDRRTLQLYPGAAAFIHLPPDHSSCLSYAGIDVVSCASNHAMDWGTEALLDSIDQVHAQGIQTIGAGKNLADAREPVVFDKGDTTIAMLGYTSVAHPGCYATQDSGGVALNRHQPETA